MSSKKKLEQRKEFKEYLLIADKRVLDIKKTGTELIADDEIFVLAIGRYGILTGIKITAFIKNLYG